TGKPQTRKVEQLRSFEDMSDSQRKLIEGITYTERGKPNLRLVSKTFAHAELRKMLETGQSQVQQIQSELSTNNMWEALEILKARAKKFGLADFLADKLDGPVTLTERSITFDSLNGHDDSHETNLNNE